jgi:hypothetical protein
MMIVAERLSQKFSLPYYCSSTPCHARHGFSSSSMSFPAAAVLTITPQFSLLYSREHTPDQQEMDWTATATAICIPFCNLLLPNEKTLQSCIVQWGMDLYLPSSSPCLPDFMLHRGIWWTHFRTRKK